MANGYLKVFAWNGRSNEFSNSFVSAYCDRIVCAMTLRVMRNLEQSPILRIAFRWRSSSTRAFSPPTRPQSLSKTSQAPPAVALVRTRRTGQKGPGRLHAGIESLRSGPLTQISDPSIPVMATHLATKSLPTERYRAGDAGGEDRAGPVLGAHTQFWFHISILKCLLSKILGIYRKDFLV